MRADEDAVAQVSVNAFDAGDAIRTAREASQLAVGQDEDQLR